MIDDVLIELFRLMVNSRMIACSMLNLYSLSLHVFGSEFSDFGTMDELILN